MSDKTSLARKDAIPTLVGVKFRSAFGPKTLLIAARVLSVDEGGSEIRHGVETDPRRDLEKATSGSVFVIVDDE
jgi:hypothetical protein